MISATVIADSIAPEGFRITTMSLVYPRIIHSELMTHRAFSRNASSSRAIPVAKFIKDIEETPALPIFWGKNIPGMQAKEEIDRKEEAKSICLKILRDTVAEVKKLIDLGLHKQTANRYLESFQHMATVVTATDWDNFYALRNHSDAQPEIEELSKQMLIAHNASVPTRLKYGEWHLPYVTQAEIAAHGILVAIKCSVARCARVSYKNHGGNAPSLDEDLRLYSRLLDRSPIHSSPAEHQARPMDLDDFADTTYSSNLRGFVQYRKTLLNETVESYQPLVKHVY